MNNENNLENIKAKVRKLLALSKSDNENEACIALIKAKELISEYNLDEDSLLFEMIYVKATKTYTPYRAIIANAVAWLYCCYIHKNKSKGMFVFTGESLYAYLAAEMYSYLIKTINRCAKKSIRKNAKIIFRRSFKFGMAESIYYRIMELGETCSWAPYRKNKIDASKKFIEKQKTIKKIDNKKLIASLNQSAINKGALYGDSVSLARQTVHTPILQIQ